MKKDINKLFQFLTEKEIEYNLAKKKTLKSKLQLKIIENKLIELEKIKIIILEIAKQSKEEIKEYIENIVTNALQIVYGNEYSFEMNIHQKRDQEEIYFYLARNDGTLLEFRKDTVAGGMVDIAHLGLRLAILSIINAEPILLLDEPLKFLGKYSYMGGQILKELSKEFNLQILLITHDQELVNIADKVFEIHGEENE
jgi:DNA repair exonuclease SbcCD ATPase subunit